MEKLYKDALRDLKKGTDQNPFFDVNWLYEADLELVEAEKSSDPEKIPETEEKSITEKTQILDSFYQFGEKKLEQGKSFSFPGGELTKKAIEQTAFCEALPEPITDEKAHWERYYSEEQTEKLIEQRSRSENCKVLFITDQAILAEEYESAFEVFFKAQVAQLFKKMVAAMKLSDEWFLTSMETKTREELAQELALIKPQYVVTLGASVTQKVLNTEKRLKNIHGEFTPFTLGQDYQFKVMPLFSPKLLSTAPNMKKAAWSDMQKIMQELNLL